MRFFIAYSLLCLPYFSSGAEDYYKDAWTYSNGEKLDSEGSIQKYGKGNHYDNGPYCEELQVLSNYTRAFPDTFWRISDGFICSPSSGSQQCLISTGGYYKLTPRYSQSPAQFNDTNATNSGFYWDAPARFASTILQTQDVYVPSFRDLAAAVQNMSMPVAANTTGSVYFVNTWRCVRGVISGCPPQALGIPFSNGTVAELCAPTFEDGRLTDGPGLGWDIFKGARTVNMTTAETASEMGMNPNQNVLDGVPTASGDGVKAGAQWQILLVALMIACVFAT